MSAAVSEVLKYMAKVTAAEIKVIKEDGFNKQDKD